MPFPLCRTSYIPIQCYVASILSRTTSSTPESQLCLQAAVVKTSFAITTACSEASEVCTRYTRIWCPPRDCAITFTCPIIKSDNGRGTSARMRSETGLGRIARFAGMVEAVTPCWVGVRIACGVAVETYILPNLSVLYVWVITWT